MLSNVNAIPTIAVKDLARAREYYEKRLGLAPQEGGSEDVQLFKAGNGMLEIYKSEFAGTNRGTAVTWEVSDLESEVKDLSQKGVEFEHYEIPGSKLEGDIHIMKNMKAAWFRDPDGNILCLHQ